MMKEVDFDTYMERIDSRRSRSISIDYLRELHRRHVLSIPFEALDVYFKKPIHLDIKSIYEKVVNRNRGGYCYELNYLFYALLTHLGFHCYPVSSRIYNEEILGPDFDHMSIVVEMDDVWLVDVGYGDLFLEPLKLFSTSIQEDRFKNYKIEGAAEDLYLLTESFKDNSSFIKKYLIDIKPRKIDEFLEQNIVKQNDKGSYFVKNRICTVATPEGRKTIFNNVYKVSAGDLKKEILIENENQLHAILKREFNIEVEINGTGYRT